MNEIFPLPTDFSIQALPAQCANDLTQCTNSAERDSSIYPILESFPPVNALLFFCVAQGSAFTFFAHSTQASFRWFYGGRGWKGMTDNWSEKYHIPVAFGALGMAIGFFGAFAMLLGFLTWPFALGLALFIAMAILKSHSGHGFFLARRPGEASGVEYTLALSHGHGAGFWRRRRAIHRCASEPIRSA